MIPNSNEAKKLWETYHLPEPKRIHMTLVCQVALFLAERLKKQGILIDEPLLSAAALLHDIDKAIARLPGEQHPDTAVRVLTEQGMEEVARVVAKHSLHAILDARQTPQTWEEKLLYLADKMVKYDVITVDKRFALWRAEALPPEAIKTLDACYPKVKELEHDILGKIGLTPESVAKLI